MNDQQTSKGIVWPLVASEKDGWSIDIHHTGDDQAGIGFNVGGSVVVKTPKQWHALGVSRNNWQSIVAETENLLDREFVDQHGQYYTLFGIVQGKDDYYYGMSGKQGTKLLSCVGSLETHGYRLVDDLNTDYET
jgi:hypothetical protein